MDTRLAPGTGFDSDDWYDVLSAVFDPLNARNDGELWGFTDDEYGAMTRGQQAVFNLRWLRDFMEADTFLSYAGDPALREHADRLVEDAALIGAHVFIPVLAEIALVASNWHETPDDALIDQVGPLESAFFELEEQHGALFLFLADYVRREPEEFIRPGGRSR
jgi:hypothetical protein